MSWRLSVCLPYHNLRYFVPWLSLHLSKAFLDVYASINILAFCFRVQMNNDNGTQYVEYTFILMYIYIYTEREREREREKERERQRERQTETETETERQGAKHVLTDSA